MKSFIFLKVYIFEDLLIFEYLVLEIYGKYNLKHNYHMLFSTLILQCYLKNWQMEKGIQKKNQNSVIIMISVVGKGTVFLGKLKLEGEMFEKRY